MRPPFDRDRTTSCSFAVVVFADRKWIEGFDELYQNEITIVPDYPEMMVPSPTSGTRSSPRATARTLTSPSTSRRARRR